MLTLIHSPFQAASKKPALLSKHAVLYRVGERDARCGKCRHFVPPANCLVVEGQITAQGKCERLDLGKDLDFGI